MKGKKKRIEVLKTLISSREMSRQDELLSALKEEGFDVTQATLSRDLKQLKVAKGATIHGTYVYILPNETMYKRVTTPKKATEMLTMPGALSLEFSSNIGVIRTRPGYASGIAFNIDEISVPEIMGTTAGDDTILIILRENINYLNVLEGLRKAIPNIYEAYENGKKVEEYI